MRNDHEMTTAFILASGPFTGGLLWERVGGRLREAGAEVHAATLTGAGEGEGGGGAGDDEEVDLETHIVDLVRLIDATAAPEVVLVGHDYAIHPVLGAAQRRVERVARIVHLDAGVPQDGDLPLALVPDPEVHALLRERPDAPVPAPEPAQWRRWGDTTGLTAADLERLSALAAPQPGRTLTRPLRLTGALSGVPTSGILCTAGGTTIEAVQQLVSAGMPQFQALADPRVGFFELATGHWPMLSCPDELARTLLRAAVGDGHRLAPSTSSPFHRRPFVLDPAEAPEVPRVRTGRIDLYLPLLPAAPDAPGLAERPGQPAKAGRGDGTGQAEVPGDPAEPGQADGPGQAERPGGGPRPAVVFVHGGPLPRDLVPAPRDWPLYGGYARYAASLGVVGAVVEHGLHALTDYPAAAADVAEAVALLRADPRVDADRIALWCFSGAGLLLADALDAPAPWLRCVAATYPILAPLPGWTGVDPRFLPAAALPKAGGLPIVLTRAGRESPEIAATVTGFVTAAAECGAALEVVDVPEGRHGFDADEPTEASRVAVRAAMRAVVRHLEG